MPIKNPSGNTPTTRGKSTPTDSQTTQQVPINNVTDNTQPAAKVPASATTPTTPINNSTYLNGDVEINDSTAPLIILFGPTSCGKTMTLIRLTKYLREKGYTVSPDKSFRPSYDEGYKNDCEIFNQTVNNPIAAPGTSGYMLVDILKDGKILCKILEAPGEYYFDPKDPNKHYPHYLQKIKNAPNRKVWCTFVEPNWNSQTIRGNYVDRISAIKPQMRTNDKMIIVFNKIDLLMYLIKRPGIVNEKLAQKYVSDNYPQLFETFKCEIPIIKIFKPYDCYFVPFQTGDFTQTVDDTGNTNMLYSPGAEAYPARLWNYISKSL